MLNRKKSRNALEKGFTLVELMIVIVVVGVLSAVALPNFLGVKDKAELGAEIGEKIGLAKACSSAILMQGPYPTGCRDTTSGATAADAPIAPVVFVTTKTATTDTAGTVSCGPSIKLASAKKCQITVSDADGNITYAEA
jgi:type IV pilus assembly protein PilA